MSFLQHSYMTRAINALDSAGWGTMGAGGGAALGMGYGAFSDDTSMIGGAFKGALAGGIAGRLGMYASGIKGVRGGMKNLETDEAKFGQFLSGTVGGFGRRSIDDGTGGWTKAWYNQ